MPGLAADLVQHRVAVIAASGSPNPALAAKAATKTIPIVFVNGGDPVADGLVARLNRPGGNITGVTSFSNVVVAKRIGLLRDLVPNARVIAVLVNPNNASVATDRKDVQEAALASGQRIVVMPATNESEIDSAFANAVQQQVGALLVDADGLFRSRAGQLIALGARYLLPVSYADQEYVLAGGLMSYGPSIADGYRQCGVYVGRILKGANPGDLPVMQPTKFELALNLKTAKALGLDVPLHIQQLADEVIE